MFIESCESNSHVMKITGVLLLLTAVVMVGQGLFQFAFPVDKETFHLLKDLGSNLIVFVVFPVNIIARNDNMAKSVRLTVLESRPFRLARHISNLRPRIPDLNRVGVLNKEQAYQVRV